MSATLLGQARYNTLGLDTPDPWSLPALTLLYCGPRAYEPLVQAWSQRHKTILADLTKLTELGFAAYQPGIIFDTINVATATKTTRAVPRYLLTKKGKELLIEITQDSRILQANYPRLTEENIKGVVELLESLNLNDSHASVGISATHLVSITGLSASTIKWWLRRWVEGNIVKILNVKLADIREIIPYHYRPTPALTNHLKTLCETFDQHTNLSTTLRLARWRKLDDITPVRVGITGTTDYDHDINCQKVLASLIQSPNAKPESLFLIEPRLHLPVNTGNIPWQFSKETTDTSIPYQPDALIREVHGSRSVRVAVEYERFQSRRNAWSHIERFCGYLHTHTSSTEPAILRFVVESVRREATYVELIEAYADHLLDNPTWAPANDVLLTVSSRQRLKATKDGLAANAWFKVKLPKSNQIATPVMHNPAKSPYDTYFKN